ncbi:MAG: hypothetical protein PHE02_04985 [Lachnospiraceae bacterium]|nr:hypothetical protein [Lachnospiraceae bacterium]
MRQITFSDVKVHNEIQLCQLSNVKLKDEIEHSLLKNRISYFERWNNPTFFQRLFGNGEAKCILCVNEAQKDKAIEIVNSFFTSGDKANFILEKVDKVYF